jgi:hypothetical protein
MLRTAKKPIFGPEAKPGKKKRKKRGSQEVYLEKNIRKIKVKNPATGRVNTLWNFRILSPKALKDMDSERKKAFKDLNKEYKKQEARLLKKWRRSHGLKKKQVEHTKELPSHLVKRHNLLVKQHANAELDMGEGPMKAKDLLKKWAGDPEEYARVVRAIDKHHKKERGRLIKEHGDSPVTMPDGTIKTVKQALQEATKAGNNDLFNRAMKTTKAFDRFSKKEADMSPKQVVNAANRFTKMVKSTVEKVDTMLNKAKEEGKGEEQEKAVDVYELWEKSRSEFQKNLADAKKAVAELEKKKTEFVEKAKGSGVEKARDEHEQTLSDLKKKLKRGLKDIEESDDSDEEKDKAKRKLIADVKKRKQKAFDKLRGVEDEAGKEKGKKEKKGRGKKFILTGLFKALAGAKKFFGFAKRTVSGARMANYSTLVDALNDAEGDIDLIMRGMVKHVDRGY